ncbi:MAG: hypothetical protein JXR70_09720 [Spirochaetales bacterium]|nr:hypothetical protein [Spirochaetales bacterium]
MIIRVRNGERIPSIASRLEYHPSFISRKIKMDSTEDEICQKKGAPQDPRFYSTQTAYIRVTAALAAPYNEIE